MSDDQIMNLFEAIVDLINANGGVKLLTTAISMRFDVQDVQNARNTEQLWQLSTLLSIVKAVQCLQDRLKEVEEYKKPNGNH